jgi:hypothetical protein
MQNRDDLLTFYSFWPAINEINIKIGISVVQFLFIILRVSKNNCRYEDDLSSSKDESFRERKDE